MPLSLLVVTLMVKLTFMMEEQATNFTTELLLE